MKNVQIYCDHCAKRIGFPDKMTVANHELGAVTLDLCWDCSALLYQRFRELKEKTFQQRIESGGEG